MISTIEIAKEAWDILRVAFKGTDAMRESRMELLTAKFEKLQMSKEKTISSFNGRLCHIANESFVLGERISKDRLVKKALSSLPLRFAYKETTIIDVKDLKRMRLEELMGSLRTFEIELNEESKERKKTCGTKGWV